VENGVHENIYSLAKANLNFRFQISEECWLLGYDAVWIINRRFGRACRFCLQENEESKPTRRHMPEDGILHSHRRENLKSFRLLVHAVVLGLKLMRYNILQVLWMIKNVSDKPTTSVFKVEVTFVSEGIRNTRHRVTFPIPS
jgi:hypothetical protein